MKNVLILYGSPFLDGSCGKMMDKVVSSLMDANIHIQNVFSKETAHCNDCRLCHAQDGCQYSDLDDYYYALENADIFVVITPIYQLSYPSKLKVIIDRHQRYWSSKYVLGNDPAIKKEKKVYLLTSCGSNRMRDSEVLRQQFVPIIEAISGKFVRSFDHINNDKSSDMTDILNEIEREFSRLCEGGE